MTDTPRETVDAGRTLDEGRWGAYQQWLVLLTALTIVFDGADNQLLGISIPAINAVQTTMYALAAHVYPTSMRATGVGTAVSIGRGGAILSGYAGPWALDYRGSASFFGLMAAALIVTFISLAIVRRHVPRPQKV